MPNDASGNPITTQAAAANPDPGGWAAIGAAYKQAGYTMVNGQWVAPAAVAAASTGSGAFNVPTDASGNMWGGDPLAGQALTPGTDYGKAESDAMAYYNSHPEMQAYVKSAFGADAWALDDPELKSVFVAAAANSWSSTVFNAAIGQTGWWRTNGAAVKNWQEKVGSDPGTAAQEVASAKASILAQSQALGVQLSDSDLTDMATNTAKFGWTASQQTQAIRGAFKGSTNGIYTGDAASIAETVKQMAGQYLQSSDQGVVDFWTKSAFAKGQTGAEMQNDMAQVFSKQAEQQFPWMKTALSQGITPKAYLAPYTSAAQTTLAASPDAIDWTAPKWQGALLQRNTDGSSAPKNIDDFNKTLMKDNQFGYSKTQNAINQAYATAQSIEQTFGKVK